MSGRDEVDPDAVAHVAELARIDLDPSAEEELADQFADILAYFQSLDAVPVVDSDPRLVNVLRPDEVRPGLTQEDAVRNAPETEDGYFKGPRVG